MSEHFRPEPDGRATPKQSFDFKKIDSPSIPGAYLFARVGTAFDPKSFGVAAFSSAPQEHQQKGEDSSVSEVGIDVFLKRCLSCFHLSAWRLCANLFADTQHPEENRRLGSRPRRTT
jgi:hypothetical protein